MSKAKRIAAALGAAGLAGALFGLGTLNQVVGTYQDAIAAASERDTVMLPMATRDLHAGVPIEADDLMLVEMDTGWLAPGAGERLLQTPEEIIGRVPKQRILVNEPIAHARLADFTTGDGINGLIEPGMRALAIPIQHAAALEGLLQPGSYVDVLVTIAPDEAPQDLQTVVVTPNVYVLAVNGRQAHASRDDLRKRRAPTPTVTLLVEPEIAEQIVHARHQGDVTLTAINPADPDRGLVFSDPIYDAPDPVAPGDLVPPPYVPPPEPVFEPDPFFLQVCKGRDCTMQELEE